MATPTVARVTPLPPPFRVTPATVRLPDGYVVTIRANVPLSAGGRRRVALAAGPTAIYFIGGRVLHVPGSRAQHAARLVRTRPHLGGYLGQTSDFTTGARAAYSFTHWVRVQRSIVPAGMATVDPATAWDSDYRRFIEARSVGALSAAGLLMLNTHTNADISSQRLTCSQVVDGMQIAAALADLLHAHVFNGQANSWNSAASNLREAAVRAVLSAAPRALDTAEVVAILDHNGQGGMGATPGFSVRRNLLTREREQRGTPRVFSAWHRGRRVCYNPALGRRHALDGYDRAHPLPKASAGPAVTRSA